MSNETVARMNKITKRWDHSISHTQDKRIGAISAVTVTVTAQLQGGLQSREGTAMVSYEREPTDETPDPIDVAEQEAFERAVAKFES